MCPDSSTFCSVIQQCSFSEIKLICFHSVKIHQFVSVKYSIIDAIDLRTSVAFRPFNHNTVTPASSSPNPRQTWRCYRKLSRNAHPNESHCCTRQHALHINRPCKCYRFTIPKCEEGTNPNLTNRFS